MLESPFLGVSDHYRPNPACSTGSPSFHVRLTFGDGAAIDARAVVSEGRITLEGLHARPPHPHPADDPLPHPHVLTPAHGQPAVRRARPSWPRGREGRLMVAKEYRAAQADGRDPVLAVMYATGRSRRRSLKLIASARDAGALPPRHNRR
ncbi:DUF6214 family protein [Streptomyces durmitorensis]|uniref:DUF6214 family protein n=1 Tax=Streptomyces durmitorensis TaxID=319947 RepID=UPI0024BE1386|nr:DUF6214 family protein [Streptomyces durmitorensis]